MAGTPITAIIRGILTDMPPCAWSIGLSIIRPEHRLIVAVATSGGGASAARGVRSAAIAPLVAIGHSGVGPWEAAGHSAVGAPVLVPQHPMQTPAHSAAGHPASAAPSGRGAAVSPHLAGGAVVVARSEAARRVVSSAEGVLLAGGTPRLAAAGTGRLLNWWSLPHRLRVETVFFAEITESMGRDFGRLDFASSAPENIGVTRGNSDALQMRIHRGFVGQ